MKILITGLHGLVESDLVVALKVHHTIYRLDIVSLQKDGVSKTFGWQELEQIPSVDLIIHLAGKAHDTKKRGDVSTSSTTEVERGRLHDEEKKAKGRGNDCTRRSRSEPRINHFRCGGQMCY